MSFTRKPYATLNQRGDFHWGFSYRICTTWLNKEGRFCYLLLCACPYASSWRLIQQPLSVLCGFLWRPISLYLKPKTVSSYKSKLLQTLFHCWSRLMQPAISRLVQYPSATSYTFFTVSHQNGFSSSIQSASNLHLVCITYLYPYSVLKRLSCNFSGFQRAK